MSFVDARAQRTGVPRIVVVLCALVVVLGAPLAAPSPAAGASLKDQIDAARKRQADLTRTIDHQESLLASLQQDQAATRDALEETARQLDSINKDQARLKAQIEKAEAALARAEARHTALVDALRQSDYTLSLLEQELASGEADLELRRQALAQRLAEAYRAETTTLLEQFLTAESFSDALTETSAYLSYGDQDIQLAQAIIEDQQALYTLRLLTTSMRLRTDRLRRDTVEMQNQIEERKAELEKAKRLLHRLEQKTKRIRENQQAHFRQLVANEKEAQQRYRELRAAKLALQRKIAAKVRQAQALAARKFGVRPGGNGFFAWPTRGTVTGEFGCSTFKAYPPGNGCAHFHDGIDIANGTGTPIYAAGDGVVAYVGFRADGAFVVVMAHANGLETVYGHMLPTYPVGVGQAIRKGTRVGSMGCTGFCFGTHLHWEVSRDFVPLNPRAFL